MDKLVSVIVPIYNSALFLDKCIQSILQQTYENIELILVNDGSTDESGYMCEQYALNDKRVKVIHKQNGGLVSSRKAGLLKSMGEYILYVDGDDWVETDLLEDYMKQVNKFNADIVVSAHNVNLEGDIEVLPNALPIGVYNKTRLIEEVYPKMLYTGIFSQFGIFSYSWGKLYKRNILLKNQLKVREDIIIGEDALCVYPTLLDANVLVILDEPYYHYRQRVNSLIKTLRSIDISKMEMVYSDLKTYFQDKGYFNLMKKQLQFYLLSLLIINTEGPCQSNALNIYPFNEFDTKKRIVLCGAGTFGQHVYKKITYNNTHNIVGWVDGRYRFYSKLNLPVTSLNSINSIDYDLVLITYIDEDNSNRALANLIKLGVDKNKIVQVSHYSEQNIEKLLKEEYQIKL